MQSYMLIRRLTVLLQRLNHPIECLREFERILWERGRLNLFKQQCRVEEEVAKIQANLLDTVKSGKEENRHQIGLNEFTDHRALGWIG